MCVNDRKCIFGEVRSGEMILNDPGKMVSHTWNELPNHFSEIIIDEFIIMPNHFHGIIIIGKHETTVGVGAPLVGALNIDDIAFANTEMGATERAAIKAAPTLGEIVGAFKSVTTNNYIHNVKNNNWPEFNKHLWQRNYYDHIIRTELDLNHIREYITNNPAMWENDEYYSA